MIVYKVLHNNQIVEFANYIAAETYSLQNNLNPELIESEQRQASIDYVQIVSEIIAQKQAVAPKLLQQLYAENTLAGITTSQSDQLFDEYSDVILRIREGAFPTAHYRLQQKQPSGFITQALIDKWIAIIATYL